MEESICSLINTVSAFALIVNKKANKILEINDKFLIGCQAVAGMSVTELAAASNLSRTTVYNEKNKVLKLATASEEAAESCATIAITQNFLERMVVSLSLDCHASLEGIQRFAESVLDQHLSIGKISCIIQEAAERARAFDDQISLETIQQGANDEIFQCGHPVLTGIDVESTYIYLLEEAGDRTSDTWELYMEDRKDHGLNLEVTIQDGGNGLMSGIPKAFPEADIQLDVFHALRYIGVEFSKLERKAYSLIEKETELEKRACGKQPRKKTKEQLAQIHPKTEEAIKQYDVFYILFGWLRELLGFSGYSMADTCMLVRFVLNEMDLAAGEKKQLIAAIAKFRKALPQILSFHGRLQKQLEVTAKEKGISPDAFMLLYRMRTLDSASMEYNQLVYQLVEMLMNDYDRVETEFKKVIDHTKKASSLVENLNSRIRVYMDLKREVPQNYFSLLKVYFNLKKYRRSRKAERKGKSPLELMSGKEQPDFLEALGY